jgi:hypothetical protein
MEALLFWRPCAVAHPEPASHTGLDSALALKSMEMNRKSGCLSFWTSPMIDMALKPWTVGIYRPISTKASVRSRSTPSPSPCSGEGEGGQGRTDKRVVARNARQFRRRLSPRQARARSRLVLANSLAITPNQARSNDNSGRQGFRVPAGRPVLDRSATRLCIQDSSDFSSARQQRAYVRTVAGVRTKNFSLGFFTGRGRSSSCVPTHVPAWRWDLPSRGREGVWAVAGQRRSFSKSQQVALGPLNNFDLLLMQ